MARTVWKYPLSMNSRQKILVGASPRVVHVDTQRGEPFVWIEQAIGQGRGEIWLELVGTGGNTPDGGKYVGTVLLSDGDFVFHIYDLGPLSDDAGGA